MVAVGVADDVTTKCFCCSLRSTFCARNFFKSSCSSKVRGKWYQWRMPRNAWQHIHVLALYLFLLEQLAVLLRDGADLKLSSVCSLGLLVSPFLHLFQLHMGYNNHSLAPTVYTQYLRTELSILCLQFVDSFHSNLQLSDWICAQQ